MKSVQIKTLHIEFTTACNSRCVMCDYWKTGKMETIDPELVLSTISEQYLKGLKTVYFTGGECLLFPKLLFSLCKRIKENYSELRLAIITNGILLAKYYREIAEVFHKVIVSLDAINPEIYALIRGVNGVDIIKNGVNLLKNYSPHTQVNLRVLVMNENLQELAKIVEYGVNQNIDRISFIPENISCENGFGRMDKSIINRKRMISSVALRLEIERIKSIFKAQLGTILRPNLDDLEYVYSQYFNDTENLFPQCNKAFVSCVINSNGLVSPCFFINGTQKISINTSLQSILDSKEYRCCVRKINDHCYSICRDCPCPKELS